MSLLSEIKNILLISIGALSAAFGIHGFLESSRFIDGGVTGISMLLSQITSLPLSAFIIISNLPFVALGYKQLGKAFAIRSIFAITTLSLILLTVHFPDITPDKLLTAVFGGFFIGVGIGLTIRGNAVLDGTEIAALLISKKSSILKVGDIILIFNILIFLTAIYFLGIEPALYSILTYFSAAKTLDFVIYGLEEFTAVYIISSKNNLIREEVINKLGRGVTTIKGLGGKTGLEQEILYCVLTKLEIGALKSLAKNIDSDAFITLHALSDVEGGVVKRASHH